MKFLLLTLITHHPDPVTGEKKSPADRLRGVVDAAVLAEHLGFDGFAVGERHEDPFISSSPPVVLSHIAARTSELALFTAVTTLSLLDPVRAFEDYSTLDNLSDGRLELIIGKGNGAAQAELFHVTTEDQCPTPNWCGTTGNGGSLTATVPRMRWSVRAPPVFTSPRRRNRRSPSTGLPSKHAWRSSGAQACPSCSNRSRTSWNVARR